MESINSIACLKIILLNKKKVLFSTLLAFVISVIVVSPIGITPLYQCNTVVYPTNLLPFASETSTEQLLQFFYSNEVEKQICNEYNLKSRYDIDSLKSGSNNKLKKAYKKHIQFSKTNFESVEINVLDKDPETALKISNSILIHTNKIIRELKLKPVKEYIIAHQQQLQYSKQKIDSINSALTSLSNKFGIINTKEQTKQLSKKNKSSYTNDEKELYQNILLHGNEFNILKEQELIELKSYKKTLLDLDKQLTDLNSNLSYFTVIVKPNLPDDTTYPNRLFIVFLVTFSTFILSICTVIILEGLKSKRV